MLPFIIAGLLVLTLLFEVAGLLVGLVLVSAGVAGYQITALLVDLRRPAVRPPGLRLMRHQAFPVGQPDTTRRPRRSWCQELAAALDRVPAAPQELRWTRADIERRLGRSLP